MDEYTNLAKKTVETFVKTGRVIGVPKDLPEDFYVAQKGVFVTIFTKNGKQKSLRGCIGTFLPTKENIAQEIIDNAISSATHDNRFYPVSSHELDDLSYEVSLLNLPEKVESLENLDAKKYGVIVRSQDGKTGLLLPDIEGIETPEQQISIAMQKAGINEYNNEKIQLFRFTVEKHE